MCVESCNLSPENSTVHCLVLESPAVSQSLQGWTHKRNKPRNLGDRGRLRRAEEAWVYPGIRPAIKPQSMCTSLQHPRPLLMLTSSLLERWIQTLVSLCQFSHQLSSWSTRWHYWAPSVLLPNEREKAREHHRASFLSSTVGRPEGNEIVSLDDFHPSSIAFTTTVKRKNNWSIREGNLE